MPGYLRAKKEADGYQDLADTVQVAEKIAASQIHLLKNRIAALRSYMDEMETIFADMLPFTDLSGLRYFTERPIGARVLLVMTGDRGLVGGLYHALISEARAKKDDYERIIVVGARGAGYAREERIRVEERPGFPDEVTNDDVEALAHEVLGMFSDGSVARIDLLYPEFHTIMEQRPVFTPFVPFLSRLTRGGRRREGPLGFPIFEPGRKAFVEAMAERYLHVVFTRFVMESKLCELSARTVTTEHAHAKAEDILDRLNLEYLNLRRRELSQAQIENFIGHTLV